MMLSNVVIRQEPREATYIGIYDTSIFEHTLTNEFLVIFVTDNNLSERGFAMAYKETNSKYTIVYSNTCCAETADI